MCRLADFTRSTAPSNGMDAKRSAGVPLSSPAAAQRCAEGAGLDSGTPDAAQSAMPSIATPAASPTVDHFHQGRCACATSTQSRISTSLTDVTNFFPIFPCPAGKARGKARRSHAAVQDLCPPPGPAGREIGTCGETAATVRRNFYCISGENPHSAALDSWVCPCWVCPSTRFWGSTCDAL